VLIAERLRAGNAETLSGKDLAPWVEVTEKAMKARLAGRSDVKFISVVDRLCPDFECRMTTADGTLVHFDASHLTAAGSRVTAAALLPAILPRE
jgi:hypothetical protein